MELGLFQTQSLKQIQTLSPQMYMSMEILCLNALDLEQRVASELESNETLERVEPTAEAIPETQTPDAPATDAAKEGTAETESFEEKFERWDQYSREEYGNRSSRFRGEKDEKQEALNNTEGRGESLQEHLEQQVHLLEDEQILDIHRQLESGELDFLRVSESLRSARAVANQTPLSDAASIVRSLNQLSLGKLQPPEQNQPGQKQRQPLLEGVEGGQQPLEARGAASAGLAGPADPDVLSAAQILEVRELCTDIIYNMDARGYLMYPLPEIRDSVEKERRKSGKDAANPVSMMLFSLALAVVQHLDPPGVGGQNLEECLLLQLSLDRQDYPLEERIIQGHLDDLGHNRVPKIARALGVTVDDIKVAAEIIASLDPLPGRLYNVDPPHYVKPDVIVDDVEGKYEVRVDSNYVPQLRINSHYRNLYKESRKNPEVKKYLKKKIDSAEWLLAAIRQRQSTLQKIAQEIVDIQKGFLDHGITHLKPLKMADVAERLGVHVSTISRAISGKYMQSARGIKPLKFFFTGGATKSDGNVEARGSVIQRIKVLIGEEDKSSPLSDIIIVRKLAESGIKISRRTVTKYREAESIPSSRERRVY